MMVKFKLTFIEVCIFKNWNRLGGTCNHHLLFCRLPELATLSKLRAKDKNKIMDSGEYHDETKYMKETGH